jgi:hypothetical protein
MAHREEKPTGYGPQKPSAAKRTANPPQGGTAQSPGATNMAAPDQQHDAKGRQGSFAGMGEHPRTGNPGHE